MQTMVKVAVDAMGGDNAPAEVIKGSVRAVNEDNRIHVVLVGKDNNLWTNKAVYSKFLT